MDPSFEANQLWPCCPVQTSEEAVELPANIIDYASRDTAHADEETTEEDEGWRHCPEDTEEPYLQECL